MYSIHPLQHSRMQELTCRSSSIQNLADVARSDTDPNTIRKASRAVSEAAEVRDMEDLFGDIYENVREEDITEVLAGVAK